MLCFNEKFIHPLIVMVFGLVVGECNLKKVSTSHRSDISASIIDDAASGSLNLAQIVVNDVALALIKEHSYTREQAHNLAAGALSLMESGGAGLTLAAIDMNDLAHVAPALSRGLIRSMSTKGAALDTDDKKVGCAGDITSELFKSTGKRSSALSDSDRLALPGQVAAQAIGSLDEAGVGSAAVGSGAGSIMKESVTGLSTMGFDSSKIANAVSAVTASGIGAISETGASADGVKASAQSIIAGAVGALSDLRSNSSIEVPSVTDMVGPLVSSAVGALKNVSYSVGGEKVSIAGSMGDVAGEMMSGAVKGLASAGVSSASELKAAINNATSGAVGGLKDAGLSTMAVASALESVVKKTVSSLAMVTNASAVSDITSSVGATALVTTLNMIDKNDPAAKSITNMAGSAAASGASNGLASAGASLGSSSEQLTREIISQALAAGQKNSSIVVDSSFLNAISQGMVDGIAKSGASSSVAKSITDSVGAGAAAAIATATSSGIAVTISASDAQKLMVASVASAVDEMETRCEQQMGHWNQEAGTCQYPSTEAPTAKVSAVEQAQQQSCMLKGGKVLYTAAGDFVCLVPDNIPPADPTSVAFTHRYCSSTTVGFGWKADTADDTLKSFNAKLCMSHKNTTDCVTDCGASASITTTSATLIAPADETSYFGCVQALDSAGNRSGWAASSQPVTIDSAFKFADTSATCEDTNTLITWNAVQGAASYDVSIYDQTCTSEKFSYDGIIGTSLAAAEEDLLSGTQYCVRIAAKNSAGVTLSTTDIVNDLGDTHSAVLAGKMAFERAYYQTRSVKRVLLASSIIPEGVTSAILQIGNSGMTCSVERTYQEGYVTPASGNDALLFDRQAVFTGILSYGTNTLDMTLAAQGVIPSQGRASVTLKDFGLQAAGSTAFATNVQVYNNYQGWVSIFAQSVATTGSNLLIAGFEPIINY